MIFITSVFLVFLCSQSALNVKSEYLELRNDTQTDEVIYRMYLDLDQNLKDLANDIEKTAMPHIMKIIKEVHLSTNCTKNAFLIISDARKLKLSALKLLDASAKIQQGILVGNIFLFGEYDECMSTSVMNKDGKLAFRGQYCMFEVKPALPTMDSSVTHLSGFKGLKEATGNTSELVQYLASTVHIMYHFPMKAAMCVPSGCTSQDIESIINYVAENTLIRIKTSYCDRENYAPTSNGKIAALCFFSIFGLLAIIGLGIDVYSISSKKYIVKLLLLFSIKKNFPRLISLKVSDKSLSYINGIRSLSVFYVILLHQYFLSERTSMMGHMKDVTDRLSNFADQIYANGYLTSEVFFFIGGFLNAYSRMKVAQKANSGKPNYLLMIAHRLIRIYPAYIVGILSVYLLSYSYGPVRTGVIQSFVEPCDRFWWRNILFINNLFPQQDVCMIHGWYIAADMQMFLLSLFTIPIFYKRPTRGIIINLAILVCGLLATATWSWHKQLIPGIIDVNTENFNRTWNVYTTPLPHIAPYFLGILIGYFLSANEDFKIPLVYQVVGWPVTGLASMSMLFMTTYLDTEKRPTLLVSVLYFTFSKLIYVSAVAWIVVCCTRGYGGVVNYILSLKVWIPIAKLSFLMFNLGPTIQLLYYANSQVVADSFCINRIWQHIGDIGIILLVSLIVYPFVEAPLFAIEKLIFGKSSSGETKDPEKVVKVHMSNGIENIAQTPIELENNLQMRSLDLRERLMRLG